MKYLTNEVLLLIIIVSSFLYVVYTCYLIHKKKCSIDENQERRVATFILFIIFFALSMVYQYHQHSCTFVVIWFIYALWLVTKETRKAINNGCAVCLD